MIDISKVQAASFLPGLQDLGVVSGSLVINSFVLATAKSYQDFTLNMPFSRNDVISICRVNLSGTAGTLSSYWIPVQGMSNINDVADKIDIFMQTTSATSGRNIKIRITNSTASASVTVPTITVNGYMRFYSYPF